jgi:bifunctional DNA-binding transcriptional regulator/antitoxin component of YhaV-PrlF toxin-antitoxin module
MHMSSKLSKLTAQGQVSVPASVRQFLSLSPGATLLWVQEGERMWVERAVTHTTTDVHQALFGKSAPPKTACAPDSKQAIRSFIQKKHARH